MLSFKKESFTVVGGNLGPAQCDTEVPAINQTALSQQQTYIFSMLQWENPHSCQVMYCCVLLLLFFGVHTLTDKLQLIFLFLPSFLPSFLPPFLPAPTAPPPPPPDFSSHNLCLTLSVRFSSRSSRLCFFYSFIDKALLLHSTIFFTQALQVSRGRGVGGANKSQQKACSMKADREPKTQKQNTQRAWDGKERSKNRTKTGHNQKANARSIIAESRRHSIAQSKQKTSNTQQSKRSNMQIKKKPTHKNKKEQQEECKGNRV